MTYFQIHIDSIDNLKQTLALEDASLSKTYLVVFWKRWIRNGDKLIMESKFLRFLGK